MKINTHTQTLFHYTKSRKSLLSILNKGLLPSYASEQYGKYEEVAIPMVSFCDIPLDCCKEHIRKYGKYGIGLSKEYLINNLKDNFGPILYVIDDRIFDVAFDLHHDLLEASEKTDELYMAYINKEEENCSNELKNLFISQAFDNLKKRTKTNNLFGFMKQYKMLRKGKWQINYDECEWRYVYPEGGQLEYGIELCRWFWNRQEFEEWKSKRNNKLLEHSYCLDFAVSDINFLLVPKEDDVIKLSNEISKLNNICNHKIDDSQRRSLQSKIISFERIDRIV